MAEKEVSEKSSTLRGDEKSLNWYDKLPVISYKDRRRTYWDIAMFFLIIVVCVVTPLRIGFMLTEWKEWIFFDIIFDLCFAVDIVVSSVTTFEFEGEEVTDHVIIFARYAKTWLVPDVLSILPLELFTLALDIYHPAFRANRLLRIGHLVVYFLQWERLSNLKPSVIRIFKSVFVVVFLAHFIGCIFHLIILIEGDEAQAVFTGTEDILQKTLGSRYIRSFYWSFVTMTGYNNTNPSTQLETMFSIFVTLTGISLFATIIGTVGSLVTNLDSSKLYFRQKMDGINDYMQYKKIPPELQSEVRNYFLYLWKSGKGLDKNKVLDDLPPYLKNKMSFFLNSELIKKVELFAEASDNEDFITEIVKALKSRITLPNSFVVRKGEMGTEMYFVSRGELNVIDDNAKVIHTFKDGDFFGEIALLYDMKRTASIVARTYCDMFVLTKDDFNKVIRKYPEQGRTIQTVAADRFKNIVEKDKQQKEQAKKNAEAQREADQRDIEAQLPGKRENCEDVPCRETGQNPLGP